MTSDDQQFLDLLASIPQGMTHYGGRIADYIEKHTNAIASDIRDALESSPWIPDSIRPPKEQARAFFIRSPPPPQGFVEKTSAWIAKNRTAIAVVVAFAGTTAILLHRRRRAHARKRRVKKLPNGAKKEIVVLACSTFQDPLTRSLALDLERRGYIVYVTVSSAEEDSLVHSEAKPDVRPLWMDLTSTVPNPETDVHPNLEQIHDLITKPSRASSPTSARSQQLPPQTLTLAGVIVLPGSSGYPSSNLTTLAPSDLVDTVNTRVLSSVLTVQQFLPLLINNSKDPKAPAAIILAYPSISMSLSTPYSIPEIVTTSSMSAFSSALRQEIEAESANITVTEVKLGNFDLGSVPVRLLRNTTPRNGSEPQSQGAITHWHSSQRAAAQRSSFGQSSTIKGASTREFHNAVFDALAPTPIFKPFGLFEWQGQRSSSVVYVGSGARLYDIAGKVVPSSLVGWMMGYRPRRTKHAKASERAVGAEAEAEAGERVYGSAPTWGLHSANSESGIWEKV